MNRKLVLFGVSTVGGLVIIFGGLIFVIPKILYPDIHDDSIITGKPCYLPCWQGLMPGKSTETEARQRIPLIDAIKQDSVESFYPSFMNDGSYSISFKWVSTRDYGGSLHFQKTGVLNEISVYPDETITPSKILSAYGPPTFVFYLPIQYFSEVISWQPSGVDTRWVYLDHNFEISWFEETSEEEWKRYCPDLSVAIDYITVYESETMGAIKNKWAEYQFRISGKDVVEETSNGEYQISCAPVRH